MVQYGSPATLAVFTQGINIGNSVDIDGLSIFDATKDGGAYIGSNDMIIYSDDTPADSTDKYIMHYGLGNPGSPEVHLHEDDFGIRDEDQITALAHTFVDTGVTDININRSYDRIGDDLDPEVYYCGEIEVYGIPGCLITFSAPEPSFLSNIALIEDPSVPGRYEYSDDSYVDEVEMTGDFPATGQYSLVIDGYELRFTFSATDIFPTEYPALSAPVVANNTDISVAPNVATNFVWNELADNGENIDNTIGTTASIDTDNSFIVSYGTKYPVNSHATYTGPNYLQPGDYCLTFDFVKTHLATDLTLAFINNRKSTKYNMNITGDLPVITNVQLFRSFDVNEDTPDGSYFFEGEINALSPDYVIKITPPSNAVPTGPYTLSLQSFDFHSSTYEYEYEEGKLDYATLTAAYPQGRYSIQVYESDGTTTVGSPIYADFGRYDESGTLQDLTMHNGQPSLLSPVPNAFQVSVLNSQPEFILNASTGSEEYDETALEIDNDDWGYQHQEIDNGPHIPEFTITEFNVSDTIPTGRLQLEISFSNVERRNIGEDLSIYCATERLTSYELVSARNNLDQAFGIDGITTTDFSFSSQGRAMLVLDNGDILVAGSLLDSSIYNCALAKYDSSGLLLSSFGNSAGKSIVSLTGSFMGEAIALQSDGKILVAGTYDNNSNLDFGIIRFNADGTQDMSFGETRTGFVATDVSSYADYAYAITVLDNDSFLVAGSGNEDFALIKYDSGGILDTSFGTSGIVVTDSGFFGNDIAYDIEILSNGSIILAGTMHNGSDYDFALIAYDSSGILVTSFGQSGKVMMDISGGSDDKLTAIDTIFENDIVVSGSTNVNGNYDFLLAKFSANGVLDVSFSEGETGRTGGRTGGLVITDFNSIDDKGLAMTVTDYNYIVVAGKTGETDKDFAIAVYEENGILDERFGNGGKIITKVTSNYDEINAVGLTGNDKLIVAGTSNYDFVVAQYDLGHRIIYVDNDSLRGGRPIFDGTSWASAYRDLQNALENAEAGSQIWIAAGTYYPVTPVDPANPTDEERKATFVLPGGVTLYGGFAGTETGLGERNSSVNQSILSGDLGTAEDNSDNSYHVVSVETSSELCELYITYGNAQNAEFTAGGGLLSFSSDLKIENCYFSENTGLRGGAIAIKSGEIDFDGCIFDSNTATHGPAIYVDMDTSVSFLNSVFAGNSSTNNGGAIVADGYVDIKNCSFGENAVTDGAGAAIWITSNGSANIDSSILWGNTDTVSNTQILNEGSLYAGYSCVMNLNPLGTNTSSDPQFLNAASVAGADGFPFTEDDGFSLDFSSPSINAANPGNTVDYDIADTQRPQGTGTDMGAYEYRNNMAPMLTGLEVSPIVYTEGNGEILLTELLTISDDSSTLASATVSISPYSFNDELLYNVRSGITSEYTGGVLTLTGPATINEFQTALRSITFLNDSEDPDENTRTISIQVNDGLNLSNTVTRTIEVTAVDDPPVLITNNGLNLDKGADYLITSYLLYAEDVEEDPIVYTITSPVVYGTLYVDADASYDYTAGEELLIDSTFTQDNIDDIQLRYLHNDGPEATDFFAFTLGDQRASIIFNITINQPNAAPVLDNIESSSLDYTAGNAPISITSLITVADGDDANLESAEITITNNYESTEDVLSYDTRTGIVGNWDSGTGMLTLSGTDTIANYEVALRNVKYENATGTSLLTREISFTVNDGTDDSNMLTRNINILDSNTAPVAGSGKALQLDGLSQYAIVSDSVSLQPGDGSWTVSLWAKLSDQDQTTPLIEKVESADPWQQFSLWINGADVQYPSAGKKVVFNYVGGNSDKRNCYTEDDVADGNWHHIATVANKIAGTISIYVDGALQNIVSPVEHNTAGWPVINNADDLYIGYDPSGYIYADTSIDEVRIWNVARTATEINNDMDVPLTGTETGLMGYWRMDEESGDKFEDSSANSNQGTFSAGDITSAMIESTIWTSRMTPEDTAISFIAAYDVDGDSLTLQTESGYSPSNGTVTYNNATATVTYTPNTDWNGSDTFTYKASDAFKSDTFTVNVTVTPVNDKPVLADLETARLNYTEGDIPAILTSFITITDVDDTNIENATISIISNYTSTEDVLNYIARGNILATWNTATGILTLSGSDTIANYKTALRTVAYENTGDNPDSSTRVIAFSVSDGEMSSDFVTRELSIIAVNDVPVISDLNGDQVTYYIDGSGPKKLDTGIATSATDSDSSDFDGGYILASITANNTTNDKLSLNTSYLSGRDETIVGQIDVTDDGVGTNPLKIHLNSSATPTIVSELLQNLTYSNTAVNTPSLLTRTVDILINDGDTGTSTTVQTSVSLEYQTNYTPQFTSTPITTATEEVEYSYNVIATDQNGDELSFLGVTIPTWLTFTDLENNTATLIGTPTTTDIGSHSVRIRVSDGNTTALQTFSMTVSNTNDPPTDIILSYMDSTNGVPWNVVGGLSVTDPDIVFGDTHSYTLTDDDGGNFIIDGQTLKISETANLVSGRTNYKTGYQRTVEVQVEDAEYNTYTETFKIHFIKLYPGWHMVGSPITSLDESGNTKSVYYILKGSGNYPIKIGSLQKYVGGENAYEEVSDSIRLVAQTGAWAYSYWGGISSAFFGESSSFNLSETFAGWKMYCPATAEIIPSGVSVHEWYVLNKQYNPLTAGSTLEPFQTYWIFDNR